MQGSPTSPNTYSLPSHKAGDGGDMSHAKGNEGVHRVKPGYPEP